MFRRDRRHINTQSDSEVLLNVLADELQRASNDIPLNRDSIFTAVEGLHRRVRGSYAIAAEISGYGVLAVRDPFGIRPLALGSQETPDGK
ncbi:amidophosphoribosyltransferase, partial [Acinetobacter baumannii]